MMQGYTTKEPIMADETKPRKTAALKHMDNKLETQSVPKKQSLKEWAMAGGGVPTQYKGREHVWHKKVKKYAAGGEVYNTTPDMSDGGQVIDGPAFSKGGTVKNAVKNAVEGVVEGVKPLVDRLNMHFKDVTKRVPELQEGAQKVQGDEMTRAEYERLVNKHKPVKPYEFVPKPASRNDAINALTADKRDLYGTPSGILQAGDPVGLRLDIPAYSDHGVWVPAVHRQAAGFGAGDRVGYESVAGVMNPKFGMSEKAALNIAAGKPKGTIATIKGNWNPMDEATAVARAQEYLNNPDWVQVGMDPERHGYFYDRRTMKPITAAEEAIQIGPLVLARKPQYGNKKDYKYAKGGDVHMEDGGAAFGVFPQMKPKRSKQDPEAAKNAPLDFLRGRIAGTLGMPGDIESLIRMLPGLDERTYLPTSEDIEQRLPFRSDAPVSRAAAGLGSLTANPMDVVRAGKAATKAAKAAKPAVGQAIEDYMFNQGLALPVIKPKGGNWLKGNIEPSLEKLKSPKTAGQTQAERIPLHERLLQDPALNDEGRATVQRHLDATKQAAALDNWVGGNLTNYVKKEMATPDDPVRLMFERRAQEIESQFQVDMGRAERTRARAEAETDPRRQANLMRQAEQQENQAKFDRDFATEHITHLPKEEDFLRLNSDDEIPDDLKNKRKQEGFDPKGMAQSEPAKRWESLSDESIWATQAKEIQKTMELVPQAQQAERAFKNHQLDVSERFDQHIRSKGLSENQVQTLNEKTPISDKARIIGDTKYDDLLQNYTQLRTSVDVSNYAVGKENPWINKVNPETPLYSGAVYDLGFDHVLDVLRQDLAAGRITPEQLNKISMDQAIQRTAEFNMEQAKKMRETAIKQTEGMPIYKDYADKGYKWIELAPSKEPKTYTADSLPSGFELIKDRDGYYQVLNRNVGETPTTDSFSRNPEQAISKFNNWVKSAKRDFDLERGLKYEGDTMGHCVGGYCPDVLEGRSRIFSLRDAKGEPHVTVEIQPHNPNLESVYAKQNLPELYAKYSADRNKYFNSWPEFLKAEAPELLDATENKIVQIKGKQNRAPKEEYLPFVQDFVKSGNWSDVGDLQNTGLRRTSDAFNETEQAFLKSKGVELKPYIEPEETARYQELFKQSPPTEGMKRGGEVHMSKAGAVKDAVKKGLKNLLGSTNESEVRRLSDAEIAGLKARGMGVPGVDFADPSAPPTMRMSEALGITGSEGKTLHLTEADRSRVFGPNRGGVGFSALQHYSEPHKEAKTVWGFGDANTTKKKINQNKDPDSSVWTTFAGSPTQHKSNTVVIKDAIQNLQIANQVNAIHPAQIDLINKRIREAVVKKTGKPLFPSDFDITDPQALDFAKTFDRRAVIGDVLLGTGVKGPMARLDFKNANPNVKWSDAAEMQKLLDRETDPILRNAATNDVGPHLFMLDNGQIERPDLNIAFPHQVTGTDLGVRYKPAPLELAVPDWMKQYEGRVDKSGNPSPVGYYDLARNQPQQFVDYKYLTNLQKSGNKKGGAIGALSQANRG